MQTTTMPAVRLPVAILRGRRELAMFGHHVRRNQSDDERDAGGTRIKSSNTEHRNEIGNASIRNGVAGDDQRRASAYREREGPAAR